MRKDTWRTWGNVPKNIHNETTVSKFSQKVKNNIEEKTEHLIIFK